MDVDNLDPGSDFLEAVRTSVGSCEVLVAVIGKHWLIASDEEGRRRLENPDDLVRLEIATALQRNIRVIPVLVDGALMPRSSELPDDLEPMVWRNAVEVSHSRFNADMGRLIAALARIFERADAERKQREEQDRMVAEQLQTQEHERLEAQHREQQRLQAERLETEQREKARLEAEQLEKQLLAARQRENEREEALQRARERLDSERREKERPEDKQPEREGKTIPPSPASKQVRDIAAAEKLPIMHMCKPFAHWAAVVIAVLLLIVAVIWLGGSKKLVPVDNTLREGAKIWTLVDGQYQYYGEVEVFYSWRYPKTVGIRPAHESGLIEITYDEFFNSGKYFYYH